MCVCVGQGNRYYWSHFTETLIYFIFIFISIFFRSGQSYLLASFHGDTNGLASIPIVEALQEVFFFHF